MEDIYLKELSIDWASDKISLDEYFRKYSEATTECFPQNDEEILQIQRLMDFPLTKEQLFTLSSSCSPDFLAVEGENPVVDVCSMYRNPSSYEESEIPFDVDLETFNVLKKQTNLREEYIKLKHRNQVFLNDECRRSKPDISPGNEFIVTIRVHFPFNYHLDPPHKRRPSCSQEITALGTENLAKVRDVIVCMEEFGDASGDVSGCPSAPVSLRLKDVYKSGMFYIDNTFYNDERNPHNLDYSDVIKKWGAKRNIIMNRVESMANAQIKNLRLRFGYPYVYQHLGNCEHLIIFSDARLLHSEDVLTRRQYPLYMSLSMRCSKYCVLCGFTVAKFIVINSDKLTRDPSYLCDGCLKSYLYMGNNKIGNFKVYRFYDRHAVI